MIGFLVTAHDFGAIAADELTWLFDNLFDADAKHRDAVSRFDVVTPATIQFASKDHFLDEQEKYARLREVTRERWRVDREIDRMEGVA